MTKPAVKKRQKVFDVVGAFIKDDKKKVLLCKRKEHDQFGSMWEFPGGKVEPNENKQEALKREIKEELSVDVKVGMLINRFQDEISEMKIYVYLYACTIISGSPKCIECQELKWVTLDEANKLNLAPADKKMAGYLQRRRLV